MLNLALTVLGDLLPGGSFFKQNKITMVVIAVGLIGMAYTYFWGQSGANQAIEKAQLKAELKNEKENSLITREADKIVAEIVAKNEADARAFENEKTNIQTANRNKCIRLSDSVESIGLRAY